MKIAEVDSWVAGATHIVRVLDEDGRAGFGQSACYAYPDAVDTVVRSFRDYLVGQDADRIEDHWHQLYRMGPFRGSILSGAVSAVDTALWDVKAQRLGVPIYELLGGRCRDRVRLHMLLLGWRDHDDLVRRAKDAVDEGFTAIKIDPLPPDYGSLAIPALTEAIVQATRLVREQIGPEVDLIVELHRSLPAPQVRGILGALVEFRPLFVEDPVQIDSIGVRPMSRARARCRSRNANASTRSGNSANSSSVEAATTSDPTSASPEASHTRVRSRRWPKRTTPPSASTPFPALC